MARRLLAALGAVVVASVLFAGAARAQTAPPQAYPLKVFVAVDSVEIQSGRVVIIRGVLQGEATASAFYVTYGGSDAAASAQFADSCQRAALLAMAKPGQYQLEIQQGYSSFPTLCRLTRAAQ